MCTAYRLDGERCEEMPAEVDALGRVRAGLRGAARLAAARPAAPAGWPTCRASARAYLDRLQALSGVPVRYVSVGTRRDQIIEVGGEHARSADRPPRHRRRALRARGGHRREAGRGPLRAARPADDRLHHRALSARHDVLLHARADRDRRRSVHRQPREAHPAGRADLLPAGRRALRARRPARARTSWTSRREADGGFRVEVRRAARRARPTTPARWSSPPATTTIPNYLRIPGEDLPARRPLLLRGAPLLASAGGGDRGGEQQRGRGARVLARGRDRDAGAFRRGLRPHGQGLGAARHHQPGQGGQHRGALAVAGSARSRRPRSRSSPRRAERSSASRPTPCSR